MAPGRRNVGFPTVDGGLNLNSGLVLHRQRVWKASVHYHGEYSEFTLIISSIIC